MGPVQWELVSSMLLDSVALLPKVIFISIMNAVPLHSELLVIYYPNIQNYHAAVKNFNENLQYFI